MNSTQVLSLCFLALAFTSNAVPMMKEEDYEVGASPDAPFRAIGDAAIISEEIENAVRDDLPHPDEDDLVPFNTLQVQAVANTAATEAFQAYRRRYQELQEIGAENVEIDPQRVVREFVRRSFVVEDPSDLPLGITPRSRERLAHSFPEKVILTLPQGRTREEFELAVTAVLGDAVRSALPRVLAEEAELYRMVENEITERGRHNFNNQELQNVINAAVVQAVAEYRNALQALGSITVEPRRIARRFIDNAVQGQFEVLDENLLPNGVTGRSARRTRDLNVITIPRGSNVEQFQTLAAGILSRIMLNAVDQS